MQEMLFLFWTLFLWSNHLAASQELRIIRAEPGHDVVLPCRAESGGDITAVEWTRPDLGSEYVFLYRNGRPVFQHPSFLNRVDLTDRQMKDGDVSVILKKVMTNDTGTYKCKVTQKGIDGKVIESFFIHLKVSPPPGQRVITAEPGQNVVLPCRAGHEGNITAVEWIRPDLGSEDVFLYRNGRPDPFFQHPSFKNRVDLQDRQMKDGDVSLILKNLMTNDTGTYECGVYQRETYTMLTVSFIRLEVSPPPPPSEPFPSWATALLVLLVLVPIVSAGVLYHFRSYFMSVYKVEVESGVESVLLPCRKMFHLPGDARVEWKDGSDRTVHVYQNGSDQPEDQDQVYKDRTVMERKLLQPGDLSLTLKLPAYRDSRIFTCSVYSRDGNILMKKQVLLIVRVPQVVVEVESGVEFVLLPCTTTVHLPGDAKVEWKDSFYKTVHVYKNGFDQPEDQDQVYKTRTVMKRNPQQPGDFSLTLKHPTYGDNRTFTCSVYSRKGNILMEKQVLLTVRVPQVVVKSGAESVLLPFRTTVHLPGDATVMWRDSNYRTVHVYKNGSDQLEKQDQVYRTRTVMERNPQQPGDLSLTLKHPTDGDSGIFTCIVYSRKGKFLMEKQVHLIVEVCQVEVEEGAESVLLPFRTTPNLPEDAKVEWKVWKERIVHVYQNGSDQLKDQDQDYKDRTVMERKPLQPGDLSLTLKLPTYRDSRIFICRVYSGDGNILMKKQVRLTVRDPQVEVEEGAESVLLPFITTPDLPEDARVVWWRLEPEPVMKVHVYQNGSGHQDQVYRTRTKMNEDPLKTGDLSLSLDHPKPGDSGRYRCGVMRGDDIMRWKTFQLKVKGTVLVQDQTEATFLV